MPGRKQLQPRSPSPPSPGLAARRIAADIVGGVLRQKRPLDEQLETRAISARCRSATAPWCGPSSRRCCAGSARCGICSRSCSKRDCRRSAPQVEAILLIGAAQILFLDVPDHASVDLSVRLAQADRHASHYSGLVNAVLRKLARDGKARLAGLDTVLLDTPDWLMRRWIAHYGEATARAIAAAHARNRRSISR